MTVALGDLVLLLEEERGERYTLRIENGARKHKGLGIVGMSYGATVQAGAKQVILLRPTPADLQATLRRKAQIILPKDLSRILFELALRPGERVLESGIGSAAATLALCHAVGPEGRVVVQELREDFAQWGRENVAAAGLAERLSVHLGDLTQAVAPEVSAYVAQEGPFAAALLDQPEADRALPHLWGLLEIGGRVACYTPQVSQMEACVHALRALGATDIRALELIERAWETKERGSRPSFDGLGHTGFLVFGRRIR
jgi:tRNA (adenine57-N1/adenine58-N1)-methyltransferase catalytic subunit